MKQSGQQRLTVIPITWREACVFIRAHHRHHGEPRGQKFAIGVVDEAGTLRGVATCGRPISRALNDWFTLEVNRTCTDGCPNANSALYGACARIAVSMGYRRIITDIQADEPGISLRAAGYERGTERKPRGNWYESSIKLRHLRSPEESGGVARVRYSRNLVIAS
jgi:hypothetical protein